MAKFRMNHARQGKGGLPKIQPLLALIAIVGAFVWGATALPDLLKVENTTPAATTIPFPEKDVQNHAEEEVFFLPKTDVDQVIHHQHYSLGYVEQHELAAWVAYELTREQLKMERVKRADLFQPDAKVATTSAQLNDYRGSGYDRGHLIPAADRAFSTAAMQETFLMSNVAPQVHTFNGGIWRELEELVRDWAYKYKKVYVVTGPLLTKPPLKKIGQNKVSVPTAFYKVILDISEPELKGIGFIIPNETSNQRLQQYAMSIDEVEKQTGIDFFADLMDETLAQKIESQVDISLWHFDEKKYELRINRWNNYTQ
ncbi:MAG: DNA/RNA non-specific endonuclease [Saprospiraceae bacterium]|nr:DNA/RNA non-specific endonuclease [Saprospiraceae bacterium]